MFCYNVFGTSIVSEIDIPFLIPQVAAEEQQKVVISYSKMCDYEYSYVTFLGMKYNGEIRAYDTEYKTLVMYENHISLLITKDGTEIKIICEEKDISEALLYCFTSGITINLYYRGYFVLHAAAFENNKKIYGFVGDSGVGKTTLLLSMLNEGVKIYSDDITAINLNGAVPNGDLPYKLWQDSLFLLDGFEYESTPLMPGIEKKWIKLKKDLSSTKILPVDCLFILKPYKDNQNSKIMIEKLDTIQIVEELVSNLHAFWCLPNDIKQTQVKFLNYIMSSSRVVYLRYPKKMEMIKQLTEYILNYINKT